MTFDSIRPAIPFGWHPLRSVDENTGVEAGSVVGELEVMVMVSTPILTQDEFNKGNLLTVKIDSAHSLPSRW